MQREPHLDIRQNLYLTQVDQLCDEFEAQLAASCKLGISPYLERVEPAARDQLLTELVNMAIEHLGTKAIADPAEALMAENTELAEKIVSVLGKQSDVRLTAEHIQATADFISPQMTPRRKQSRGLKIRCPHCSNHVELVSDAALDSIGCTACGSHFSLVDDRADTRMAQSLQKIDRFELLSRLGVGGFGTVWKARDTDLDRAVAVKIPRHGQLSAEEMDQFFREARSVAQLRHPNIVPVHEVGREGDAVFIVSDLVRGVSLSDYLSAKRMDPQAAAKLCVTLSGALEHAHQKGIIHRDLKPSNVMIDEEGVPFLMDFGLAKREADEVAMTMDGQIIGTPAYMSPEQAGGSGAWADRRTDIYSLGVMLFELLTGELPFRGNAQMQVHQRLTEDAPNASTLNRHLPKDLTTICAKCLEREPGRRLQTAKEVGEELQRYLNREPIKSRPISRLERTIRWAERKPLHATIVGLVTFLSIAGPTAAVLIEQQRARLGQLVIEKDGLILKREEEGRAAMTRSTELQARLDVWEGQANPWKLWPPVATEPPQRQQLAAFLTTRGKQLEQPLANESAADRALRLLTLATLNEGTGRGAIAQQYLTQAVEALNLALASQPQDVSLRRALADSYDRLSQLTSADRKESLAWLQKSLEVKRELASERLSDPQLQAAQLEAELHAAAAAGFKSATTQLEGATQVNARLSQLWPTSPAKAYRLACQLAGRTPLLEADEAATAPNP